MLNICVTGDHECKMKIDFVLSMHFVDYGGFHKSLLIQHKYVQSDVSDVKGKVERNNKTCAIWTKTHGQ